MQCCDITNESNGSTHFRMVMQRKTFVFFRNFEEIYDVDKFIKSLDGVVKVVKIQPENISARNLEVVRIPNRVTEDHIAEKIEPSFRAKGNIRLATYFPSVNMKKTQGNINSVACLATYGTLELQPEVLMASLSPLT